MSQQMKRWGGFIVGAVCAILVVGGAYYLKSGGTEKRVPPDRIHSTPSPMATAHPVSPVSSPTPTFPSPQLVTQTDKTSASISGTVRFADSNDLPDSGTRVLLYCEFRHYGAYIDQEGRYTIKGIPPYRISQIMTEENYSDFAESGGTSTSLFQILAPLKPGEHRTGVDIVLPYGRVGVISGKVTGFRTLFDPENEGGTTRPLESRYQKREIFPVAGVGIHLRGRNNEKVSLDTVTDVEGNYKFSGLMLREPLKIIGILHS